MPGTFSQLYIQIVFAVGGRQNLIAKTWSEELYKYISGIITAKKQKSIIVNGMPDHIHIFIGLRPSTAVSDVVRDIKNNSTNFINKRYFVKGRFFGRMDLEHFRIHSHILKTYMITFYFRKIIMQERPSKKSTSKC